MSVYSVRAEGQIFVETTIFSCMIVWQLRIFIWGIFLYSIGVWYVSWLKCLIISGSILNGNSWCECSTHVDHICAFFLYHVHLHWVWHFSMLIPRNVNAGSKDLLGRQRILHFITYFLDVWWLSPQDYLILHDKIVVNEIN